MPSMDQRHSRSEEMNIPDLIHIDPRVLLFCLYCACIIVVNVMFNLVRTGPMSVHGNCIALRQNFVGNHIPIFRAINIYMYSNILAKPF